MKPTSSKSENVPNAVCRTLVLPSDCARLRDFEWSLPPAVEKTLCAAFNVTREQFYQIVDEPAVRAKCEADFQRDFAKIAERIEREWGGGRCRG